VIGLPPKLSDKSILGSKEFFGQYGKITKIVPNNNKGYITKGITGPTYSAYIAYSNPFEACVAILSTDNYSLNGHTIRSSFGTTKYCTYFLKGYECPNPNCLFIHNFVNSDEIINKDDMVFDKNVFVQQQVLAMRIADIFNPDIKKKMADFPKLPQSSLPHPNEIYSRDTILEQFKKAEEVHDSKIFNKDEYEDYFGDKNDDFALKKKEKEEKYMKFAARQSSEVSNCSKNTTFASFPGYDVKKFSSFSKRNKSRFAFVLEDPNEEVEVEVPDFLLELTNTSLAYYSRFKKFLEFKLNLNQMDDKELI
jgi:CCR4-NOT transcription complex subunit 4